MPFQPYPILRGANLIILSHLFQCSTIVNPMEPLIPRAVSTKRRKLKHVQSSENYPSSPNVPCAGCRCLTIDHRPLIEQAFASMGNNCPSIISKKIDLPFHLKDEVPDFPLLRASFENGCHMCGELRASLENRVSISRLSSQSQKDLEIQLQASLQCDSDLRPRSLTFRCTFASVYTPPDRKSLPQIVYDIFVLGSKFSSLSLDAICTHTALRLSRLVCFSILPATSISRNPLVRQCFSHPDMDP